MLRLLVCRQSAKDRSSAESNEGHQRGPEAIVRHQRSMHMHLKGLLEVHMMRATMLKPIMPSRETMTMRGRSLPELTQLIEQAATLSRGTGTLISSSSRFTFGHGVRGDPATRSVKRSRETLERELLAWF
jgi:hypothetical protein